MSLMETNSISDFLGAEFSRRKVRNKSYSLRAFARDLEMSPSRLSEVIKGKEGLSEITIDTIAKRVTNKAKEQKFLKDLVLSEHSRNSKVRTEARKRVEESRKAESFRKLQEDQFKVISDWYHGAIMELTQLSDFKPDVDWVANRLGITRSQVDAAVERLEKLGLVSRSPEGWRSHPDAFNTFSAVPSTSIRKFHLQILDMHAESTREDSNDIRELQSMIVAVPKAKLDEFRAQMQKFMTQFWQNIETDTKDDLYSVSIQLCPVRNRRRKE